MQSKPAKPSFTDLAAMPGSWGREDCQAGWHCFAARLLCDCSAVLDVGSGLGRIKERFPRVVTQDVAPWLAIDVSTPIERIADKSYDAVTCFDVLEHVVEDVGFVAELLRIARRFVFVTTPNELVSHAANGCHCREYTPAEFMELFGVHTRFYVGDGQGNTVEQLREFPGHTWPHQAALVRL